MDKVYKYKIQYIDTDGKSHIIHVDSTKSIEKFSPSWKSEHNDLSDVKIRYADDIECEGNLKRINHELTEDQIKNLGKIKEGLHDAPVEVKEAFNIVVGYFDTEYFGNPEIEELNNKFSKSGYITVSEAIKWEELLPFENKPLKIVKDAKLPGYESMLSLNKRKINSNIKESLKKAEGNVIWRSEGKGYKSARLIEYNLGTFNLYRVVSPFGESLLCKKQDLNKLINK